MYTKNRSRRLLKWVENNDLLFFYQQYRCQSHKKIQTWFSKPPPLFLSLFLFLIDILYVLIFQISIKILPLHVYYYNFIKLQNFPKNWAAHKKKTREKTPKKSTAIHVHTQTHTSEWIYWQKRMLLFTKNTIYHWTKYIVKIYISAVSSHLISSACFLYFFFDIRHRFSFSHVLFWVCLFVLQ